MNPFTHSETNRAGTVGDKPTIDAIRVEWAHDDLTQPTFLHDEGEEYREENQKRLDAYDRGEWSYCGCYAVAHVSYPVTCAGDRRLETLRSGGLWGIESNSGADYESEVQAEELADLKAHLEKFGIDTSDFWQKVAEGTTSHAHETREGITLPTPAPNPAP
jgi:hypothetical protein